MIFARKIDKIPEFYTIFARKMPVFYIITARKIFFKILGGTSSHAPVSYAYGCGQFVVTWRLGPNIFTCPIA